jgi:hypothetical protein
MPAGVNSRIVNIEPELVGNLSKMFSGVETIKEGQPAQMLPFPPDRAPVVVQRLCCVAGEMMATSSHAGQTVEIASIISRPQRPVLEKRWRQKFSTCLSHRIEGLRHLTYPESRVVVLLYYNILALGCSEL